MHTRSPSVLAFMLAVTSALLWPRAAAVASDPEGCLSCHRYAGLARIDAQRQEVRLFGVDPSYYDRALGPHAKVPCTGCHQRDQVAVIPHKPVSPVDCTRACHLAEPGKVEVTFAHDRVKGMLDASVHGGKVLAESNRLLGEPLRPGQAACLLCHDEPTFRRAGQVWASQEEPVQRCATCHDGQIPVEQRYFYWHVHARSRPSRSPQDAIRVCALCHSNEQVKQHFKLPDATVSYLASFHGKAVMLGSQDTAVCLDCHVGPLQNVHQMQAHGKAGAAVSKQQLPDTCRSPKCHRAAGQSITSAAVHLELPTSRGIEYLIACVFVLLIVFTFGPSVGLTALDLLQIVVGRHDPKHHHHRELARKLQADPAGRKLLQRFTVHQRLQHWLLAVSFGLLVATGFPIKFADHAWARWLIDQFGGLSVARHIHRYAGLALILGLIYHMLYVGWTLLQRRRATGQGLIACFLDLPMVMRPGDLKHVLHLLAYLLFLRKTRPQSGRFNPEEKFEYFGVFWGVVVLGVTGLFMWANAWASRYVPGRVLTVAMLLHTFEAFLALVHVGVVHVLGVTLSPGVFPLSPAMFTGKTPPDEMAESHSAMIDEAQARLAPPSPAEVKHG